MPAIADPPGFDSTDPLARVLHFVRVSGTFYCHSELGSPWGLFLPPMPGCMWFHCVNEGRALLEVDGAVHELERGSFALVPHGRGHRIRSARRVAAPNVVELPHELQTDRYAVLRHGGDGPRATLLCGVVKLDATVGAELERSLPPVLHVEPRAAAHGGSMEMTLALMAAESKAPRPGGETIVTRLADVLVVQAIREWIEVDPAARSGWLGALRDPKLGPALAALWGDPSRDWTVAGLARVAAMSRSAFAARFEELVGEPPMRYLARMRMRVASAELAAGHATVAAIAERAGYRSEAAFSRAFKRLTGLPPGAVRRAGKSTS
ncbi:AraC family transcriptional regulator [Vulgatibacter sp.]|uniref:AraC family transcriptional regulator n=1 Tax=Vulgatibacter sp. TaxID=1971226 RepID=UPI00356A7875